MRRRYAVILLAGLLLGAAPVSPPEDSIRRGNAALARGEYAAAVQAFDGAEERATDPGLVAFNKGVALYHQGDHARAEAQFRMALHDAPARRRAGALYNLAASLVRQAGDRDAAKLEEAVARLEECLRDEEADDALRAHARHNLELAKLLWVEAKARPEEQEDPSKPKDEDPPPSPRPDEGKTAGTDLGSGRPKVGAEKRPAQPQPGQDPVGTEEQPAPGVGKMEVIPDTAQLVPMTPEDATAHLKQAIDRVLEERRAYQKRTLKPPTGNVPDW
jgi:tetratricopeptide (TPR) repeat protein